MASVAIIEGPNTYTPPPEKCPNIFKDRKSGFFSVVRVRPRTEEEDEARSYPFDINIASPCSVELISPASISAVTGRRRTGLDSGTFAVDAAVGGDFSDDSM